MAYNNDKKDQESRNPNEVMLKEKARRLRMAECAAKGGEYVNGKCIK
jgi:hypothetical protein